MIIENSWGKQQEITPLIYDKEKYTNVMDLHDEYGYQWVFTFPNNYGLSVIKRRGSYGCIEDLFEVGFLSKDLEFDDQAKDIIGLNWHLAYFDEWDSSIEAMLTNDDVLSYLEKISQLKEGEK